MLKQIHLQYRFLGRHGLYGESLAADDFELLILILLSGRIGGFDLTLQSSFPQPLRKTGLVLADLPLNCGNAGIDGGVHVVGKFACPVIKAVVFDGDLGKEAASLGAEGQICIALGLKKPVKLAHLALGIGSQVCGGIHLLLGKSELHLCQLLSALTEKPYLSAWV